MTDPRAEIWESFVSLLRCYAAAASVPGSEYRVMSTDGAAQVHYEERVLSFGFQPTSGDGTWQIIGAGAPASGAFHMREDSTLEFPNETKELDMAAIDFVEQLAQSNPELPGIENELSIRPERAQQKAGIENELSSRPKRTEGERSGGTCFSPARRHNKTTRVQQPANVENKLSSRPNPGFPTKCRLRRDRMRFSAKKTAHVRPAPHNLTGNQGKRAEGERSGGTCFSLHAILMPDQSKHHPKHHLTMNRSPKS